MLARLWHSPAMTDDGAGDPVGTACIGSSEAIMLGCEWKGACMMGAWAMGRGKGRVAAVAGVRG